MIRCIRPIGNSSGIIIDKPILDLLKLQNGSSVDVSLAPGGKGILLTPVKGADAEETSHKARVRVAGEHVRKRQSKVFKKLAE